jgi:hypothetical protein
MQCALLDAAYPGLHQKPLDTTIGQLLAPYAPEAAGATENKTTMKKCTNFAGCFDGRGCAPV